MRNKKLMFMFFTAILASSLVISADALIGSSPPPKALSKPQSKILKFHGPGFLEIKENGLKVLHVKGTSYERGYQHGVLLKDEIEETLTAGITMMALLVRDQLGLDEYEAGLKKIIEWRDDMKPFIPPEYRKNMEGIADGMAAKGSTMTYDDIMLWNTVNDSRMMRSVDTGKPGIRRTYSKAGCMTVSAWGEATTDGRLIQGKNMDWYTVPEMRKNPIVMVVDPTDGGHGFLIPIYPGWIACIEGMNEKGISMGLEISSNELETMHGMGWHFLTKQILKYADSIDDVITILTVYPSAAGNIIHIADAKTNSAAVIEFTANEIGVIYPEKGRSVLWSTNHFNGYPGWQGYTGTNMVATQGKRYRIEDISTIEKWQDSLAKIWRGRKGRYGRIRQILNENYGKMTGEKMIKLVSDRYDQKTSKVIGWDEMGATCSALWAKDKLLSKNVKYYKSARRGPLAYSAACIWSLVMVPATGDLWIAMQGPVPAQKGTFRYLNLHEELRRSR